MVSSSFPAGSEVEVRSNEEGFKGAWFEATVHNPLPKYRRYTVTYASLVSDELTGKPLEDTVHCSFVRPRPPPRPAAAAGTGFELHQLVEAYHNDAWWKGVVSEVPKALNGLYRVCFPSSREELEFKAEELREQLIWAKGKWVAVKDREVDEDDIMFDVGSRVEVSRDKENYGAAWFVGTVLKVIGKNNFLVEYESLRVDNDGSSGLLLKEIVDLQYIRPSPPASEFDNFVDILEEVEAFHEGGWVAGVVSELRRGSRYIIQFKHQEEEIELDRMAIRPRFEWTNEHWVYISREKSSNTVSAMGTRTYSRRRKSRAIKISSLPIPGPSFSGNDGEVSGRSEGSSMKAKKSEDGKVEGGVGTSQPCKKLKIRKSLEEHLKLVDETNSVGHRRKRRSRVRKRSTLSIAALSSRINNSDIADRSAVDKSKDKKVEESSIEERIDSCQPHEKSEKGKSLEEHLQLLDSTLMNCGTKSPRMIRKRSSVGTMLEGSGALVTGQTCSKSPRLRVGAKSTEHVKDTSKVNGNDSVNNVEGSSSCLGDVPENQSKTADLGHSPARENTKTRRKKLVKWSSRHKRKTLDVDDVKQQIQVETRQHVQEETEVRKRGRPPKKKISYMNVGTESQQLEERKAVGGEDRTEPSNQTPTADASDKVQSLCHDKVMESKNSLLTVNMDGLRPANDVTGICLYNMQADIMDNSPKSPQIDSSILVAKSLQNLTIQQSPTLKSFNGRLVETEAEEQAEVFPPEEDIHDHDKLILNGSKNRVEMEKSHVDPTPDGLSLLKEYNACDQNELTTSGSPSGKAYVEIEDRAPIDHSPNGSSLSREDYVPDGKESTPSRSLSEKTVVEKEKVPNDLKPCGSSPSKEDVCDHDELTPSGLPSEKAIVEAEGRTEIYPMPSMSLSSEVALPFMKESSMWEIVDSMEVFHTTPQQPHFQPLEQYEVEFREGMAIGLMVTFANLVSSIQKLQISDSQDIFEEKLKAFMPLELHGFNIQFARSRLEKLLEIRSSVCQSEDIKGSLKERILETVNEKEQVDTNIAAHDKIILELEENLYRYKERRTSMILGRNRKDSEIARLKMDLQATEEAYFSAEEHFKAVANAPW